MSNPNDKNSKSLGRGLSSLIGADSASKSTPNPVTAPYFPKTHGGISNQILEIPLTKITANPHQPRTDFKEIPLNDLVTSIRHHGILQPLVATQTLAGKYELIAGERRLRAAQIAGLKTVPVIVRTAKELEKLQLSLIENIQRQDLNPIEKAFSYKKMIDEFGLTHEEAASKLGTSRSSFSNLIRLLSLPPDIQQGITAGKISLGQAKVLLEVKNSKQQEQLYKNAIRTGSTVSDTQHQVNKIKIKTHTRTSKKEPRLKSWEDELGAKLNTRASIKKRGDWGGFIQLEFYSDEELANIINKILS